MSTQGTDTPRKRQRTLSPEHSPSCTPLYTHHESLWFRDGNVILISQDKIGFRVHKTILSRRSEIFKDMFTLANPPTSQDEWVEGCPFIELGDLGADLVFFLDPLYAGGAGDHFKDSFQAPFEMVTAMAKLGTEYQVPHLVKEAIRRIEDTFPPYPPSHFHKNRSHRCIVEFDGLSIAVLNLARELDLRQLLPAVFYACAFLPPSIQVNGASGPDGTLYKLSPEDLTICLTGKDLIKDAVIRAAAEALKTSPCECTSNADYLGGLSSLIISKDGWDPILNLCVEAPKEIGACELCYSEFTLERRDAEVWANVGKYFGLET